MVLGLTAFFLPKFQIGVMKWCLLELFLYFKTLESIGLLVMPQFIEITGVWLAVPVAEILTLCISLYLNFRLWRSWNNQNNSYEKIQKGYYDRS